MLHSKDLVNWKVVNYILPKVPEERYDKPVHGCGVWAPAIRYHDGTFFACFPMPDEGIYMSTTKDPFEHGQSQSIFVRVQAGLIRVRFGMKMAEHILWQVLQKAASDIRVCFI